MGCKGDCGRAKDEDDYVDVLSDGTYFKLDQYGDIIGVTNITTQDFFDDDEDEFFEGDILESYILESDFFGDDEEDDLDLSLEENSIVDVDYVAELLQGLEPQELNYISKVCELLIAEGEL